jgi:D-glycero-D-manno-heptose 1,7-bisphosphate phosphatase
MASKKLILLDRDGVVNVNKRNYVKSLEEFEYISGSLRALQIILESGFELSICSNQRGVSLGVVTDELLSSIETHIKSSLPANQYDISYYYCCHSLEYNCECRKPRPGLLHQAMKAKNVHPNETLFVGDNLSDYYAACNAGIDFVLVLTGHGRSSASNVPVHVPKYQNLLEFASSITLTY